MAGETTRRIGDFGEDFFSEFFSSFSWTQLGDSGVDFECVLNQHKTPKGRDKKTHGLDAVYCYENPFNTDDAEVFVVEGKNVLWGISSGDSREVKLDNAIEKELSKYLRELQEKLACAIASASFKELFGLKEKSFNLRGLIFYYVRDEFFSNETYERVLKEISVPSDVVDTSIYVITNDRINPLGTMFNHLKKKSNDGERTIEYMIPRFERKTYTSPWSISIPIEVLFSKVIITRVHEESEVYKHYIFYFGEYTQESMKRLLAVLERFNVFALPNLKICPLGVTDAIKQSIPFKQYFANNKLQSGKVEAEISVEMATPCLPSFSLVGE